MHAPPTARRTLLGSAAAWLAQPLTGAAQPEASAATLWLGVLPHVSARVLTTHYQPLRDFLQAALGRPVQLVTAADFAAFHARSVEGWYGLWITASNLAALSIHDGHGQALALFEPGIPALAVAPQQRPQADAVAALRGRRLALCNPASLVALRGTTWLREKGLEEGRDYRVVAAPHEDSLARWLDSGAAPLALMSRGEFNQLSPARRQSLAVVQQYATVSGLVVMAPASLGADDTTLLRQALQGFFASPALQAFSATTGVRTARALTDTDLALLDPYLDPTRRRLAATR